MVMALLICKGVKNLLCQGFSALSAFCPYLRKSELTATLLTEIADERILCFRIGHKGV